MSEKEVMERVENNSTSETTGEDIIEAESVTIVNVAQIQSIDISTKFRRQVKDNGWILTLLQPCKATVNLSTSIRKVEVPLLEGDQLIKEQEDLFIVRKQAADQYRNHRSSSPLAKSRDELVQKSPETI
ncbi:hypothetical protein CMK19_04220 [Candidatus Poribacteria bacterium]|nr:hypothetical protein [Candidatus Poribacteria bacterium]MEE2909050.1 hypothetical protein [Candidatus Poribacteria bacterium]|tara:strand:- start:1170 stop:1556 length:387 start_codon:yes stop_codon:yes gene_type:complete